MSDGENPYQAPVADAAIDAEVVDNAGLWRKDHLLVMHKHSKLPARCIKSNRPADEWLPRHLSWHHPAIYLTLLISILVYVILALVLRKKASIEIGLTDEWMRKRRRRITVAWGVALVSMALMTFSLIESDQSNSAVFLFVLSTLSLLCSIIYGLLGARMIAATRISDTHVWIKGVCSEFLADLPQWPEQP